VPPPEAVSSSIRCGSNIQRTAVRVGCVDSGSFIGGVVVAVIPIVIGGSYRSVFTRRAADSRGGPATAAWSKAGCFSAWSARPKQQRDEPLRDVPAAAQRPNEYGKDRRG
jgi:hypothetical protein